MRFGQRALRGMLCAALLCAVWMLCPLSTQAGIAYPGAIDYHEPATGLIVTVYQVGDEAFHYITDAEQSVLVQDAEGYLRYVEKTADGLTLSGYVTQPDKGMFGKDHVKKGAPGLQAALTALYDDITRQKPSTMARSSHRDIPQHYDFVGDAAEGAAQVCDTSEDQYLNELCNRRLSVSTCPLLVVRVQFNDTVGTFSESEWEQRLFEDGIARYYSAMSNNSFTYVRARENSGIANNGVATVTLPIDCPPYTLKAPDNQNIQSDPRAGLYQGTDGKNYAVFNMGSIFAYAVLGLQDAVPFEQYDKDNDGYITPQELAIIVVFPGYDAAYASSYASAGYPAVWAHSWKYNNLLRTTPSNDAHYCTIKVDGKKVFKYTVMGELNNTPTTYNVRTREGTPIQAQYGTACHELAHDLGLRDLYDTGTEMVSMNVWSLSLMAHGSWGFFGNGFPGSCPAQLDAYAKVYLGFVKPTVVRRTGSYRVNANETALPYNILRVNTANPDVYYLIENRRFVGFDRGMACALNQFSPGGTVVWRIDEEVLRAYWDENSINAHEGHYGIMPLFTNIYSAYSSPFWDNLAPEAGQIALRDFVKLDNLPITSNSMKLHFTFPTPPPTGDDFPLFWLTMLGIASLFIAAWLVKRQRLERAWPHPTEND